MTPVRKLVLGKLFIGLAACGVILALASVRPAAAELATWDQGAVTALANELVEATTAWQLAIRQQPGGGEVVGSGDSQQQFGLVYKSRALQEQAQALAGHLAKGEGHDKTRNYYRSFKEMSDDSVVLVGQSELDEPTLAAWNKVLEIQHKIAPYYDPKADAASSN